MVYLPAIPAAVEVNSDTEDYIVAGDNLTLTCRVGYKLQTPNSIQVPYIRWQLNDRRFTYRASQFTDADDQSYPGMPSVRVSELDITVPDCAAYLPKYSCTIQPYAARFYYYRYRQNYTEIYIRPSYEWSTPSIKISCKY